MFGQHASHFEGLRSPDGRRARCWFTRRDRALWFSPAGVVPWLFVLQSRPGVRARGERSDRYLRHFQESGATGRRYRGDHFQLAHFGTLFALSLLFLYYNKVLRRGSAYSRTYH